MRFEHMDNWSSTIQMRSIDGSWARIDEAATFSSGVLNLCNPGMIFNLQCCI